MLLLQEYLRVWTRSKRFFKLSDISQINKDRKKRRVFCLNVLVAQLVGALSLGMFRVEICRLEPPPAHYFYK